MLAPHKPLADVGLGVSLATPFWAWLGHANEAIQALSGVIAILSGIAAGVYYICRIIALRKLHHVDD